MDSGSESNSDIFENNDKDDLSEEDRINKFVRMCDMAEHYRKSGNYYRNKIYELERDEQLLFKFEKISYINNEDIMRRDYLKRCVSKLKWGNNNVSKYIEYKRKLYVSEVNTYYDNALYLEKIVDK